jgi:pimeloyl-ACP methyl ester carboxylesterase
VTVRSIYQTGYTGSEASVTFCGRLLPGGVPVILCHGVLATATQFQNATEGLVGRYAADNHEVTLASGDLGGASTWGNDTSIAAVTSLVTYLGSNYGTSTSRVALYGTSMGALTALNWAIRNTSKVVAVGLTAPAVSLQGIHDRDPSNLAAAIDTAYTNNAGYLAALATDPSHDPSSTNETTRRAARLLGPRTRIWYSTDDPVIAAAEPLAYAGFTGCAIDSMGAIGHTASEAALRAAGRWMAEMAKAG